VNGEPCRPGFEFEAGELTFIINGIPYSVPSHHWIERNFPFYSPEQSTCQTYVSELTIGPATLKRQHDDMHLTLEEYAEQHLNNMFIVGDLFMSLYYTIFDRDTNQIGLALAKHEYPEVLYYYDQYGRFVDQIYV